MVYYDSIWIIIIEYVPPSPDSESLTISTFNFWLSYGKPLKKDQICCVTVAFYVKSMHLPVQWAISVFQSLVKQQISKLGHTLTLSNKSFSASYI